MTIGELHELIVEAKNAERSLRDLTNPKKEHTLMPMSRAEEIANVIQQLRAVVEQLDIF